MAKCYVVWKGNKTGVFENWADCQQAVAGYSGAKFKGFTNIEEAKAAFNPTRPPAQKRARPATTNAAVKFEVMQRFNFPVQIYADGACNPNPGPCASGVVVLVDGAITDCWLGAYSDAGTNNAAELRALAKALTLAAEYTERGLPVEVLSDSSYSLKAVALWAASWEANGWTKKDGVIANLDLIKPCYELLGLLGSSIQLTHVEGHAGNAGNELADQLAGIALDQQVIEWVRYDDTALQQQEA